MIIAYFGCWQKPGHYLWGSPGVTLHDQEVDRLKIPKNYHLDASVLFLPYPEKVGQGCLTYLPAPNRTILAWWGSPFDNRGKVNCAVIIEGKKTADEIWSAFKTSFPDPDNLIVKPNIV